MKKRILSIFLAVYMLFAVLPLDAVAVQEVQVYDTPFRDVVKRDWFFDAVQFVHENGIMAGTSGTTFAPEEEFTRAMAAATLFRIYHGRPANARDSRAQTFYDVASDTWFVPYIAWAYNNGIADGVGGNRFVPERGATRQELAAILFRFVSEMLDDVFMSTRVRPPFLEFSDRYRIADWAWEPLIWANNSGLITGRTARAIVPYDITSRAEAATILMRLINMDTSPPPEINIQTFLYAPFDEVKYGLGDFASSYNHSDYRFDTEISVLVGEDRVIYRISIRYSDQESRDQVHFSGINGNSTRGNVRNILGVPDFYDFYYLDMGIYGLVPGGVYIYWNLSSPSALVVHFALDQVIGIRYESTALSEMQTPGT